MILKESIQERKSTLVQKINEVDDLSDEEKDFVLYWLRAKKSTQAAAQADLTIIPNITPEDIYEERSAERKQKSQ